jgi:outer membrane protein OmpA-like peptidoglycan-associated protein
VLDSFAPDKADLTPAHTAILDGIVTKMKAKPALRAELGGAADLKDADPATISQGRADAAKNYLVSKGIAVGRIQASSAGLSQEEAA